MADLLGVQVSARFKAILTLVACASMLIGLGVTWASLGAQITALQVADMGFATRDSRIELAQERTNIIALENQRTLAAIEAKIDILLKDR
jgi:uncharacterized membrane protein YphA (DoxX/SURF4 family)